MKGILCFANINFQCPYCGIDFHDSDERFYNRITANKSGITKAKCSCGETFGVTQDIKCDLVGFKLNEAKLTE